MNLNFSADRRSVSSDAALMTESSYLSSNTAVGGDVTTSSTMSAMRFLVLASMLATLRSFVAALMVTSAVCFADNVTDYLR
jgi:hypothetical protein